MPLFEIIQHMTAIMIVECESEKEALNWADRIVADIADEDGNQINSSKIISFEASAKLSEIEISKLQS